VSYNILQKNIKINTKIYSGSYLPKEIEKTDIKNGFSLPIKYMPLFSVLSNIEIRPFKGAVLVRAAEASSVLIGKDIKNGYLKLRSGWNYKVNNYCMSSVGANSNRIYNNEVIAKAGKNRALGRKPKVRGVAKNPCDHPHGGANGKKNNPVIPKNAWSTVFKWRHTNNKVFQNVKRRKYKNV
jgi:large subunit ribosomal protein L2